MSDDLKPFPPEEQPDWIKNAKPPAATETSNTVLPNQPTIAMLVAAEQFHRAEYVYDEFKPLKLYAGIYHAMRAAAPRIQPAASEAGAVPALTPSPGLRRAYQEVFNGAAPPAQPEKQAALAVGRVRHFQYSGIARNGFSQEPELFDGAPILPDGALLYAYPPAPIQQPTGHSFDAGRAVWVSRDEAERMFPAPSQQAGADACGRCNGSGESMVLSGGGPDAYDELHPCPDCKGTSDAAPAAQGNSPEFEGIKTVESHQIKTAAQGDMGKPISEGNQQVAQGDERVAHQLEDLIERLLDAQQDINLLANETMSQTLCSASTLLDEIEVALRASLARQQGGGDADFEIRQDGMPVAATSGPRERSLANAQHYAMMYSADGPVDLVEIVKIAHIDAARAQRAAAQEKPE